VTAREDAPADAAGAETNDTPPHLDESVRRVGAAGRATLDSALDTGRALRKLVSADLALARSAMGRALAWVGVAIVFGASAGLLVMGVLIALLHSFGMSWLVAFAICAALTLAVTGFAAWRVSVFFEYAGMHATRRQLARLGIGDESPDDDDADAMAATAPASQAGTP